MSDSHKPGRKDEMERIQRAGKCINLHDLY